MFKQLFASMNEALDDIIAQFPQADAHERKHLQEKLSVLKAMSDTCIEEWLLFEEKMGQMVHPSPEVMKPVAKPVSEGIPAEKEKGKSIADSGSFSKGQGYYKLGMFREAVTEFEEIVEKQPDFILARMFLAMSYLRYGEFGDAYRHFQFLVPLTDDRRIKAISYNAMGCIHAERNNMDKAMEYFKMAYSADPGTVEPALQMSKWPART